MYVQRALLPTLEAQLTGQKNGVVIYGPRQVGKTTLANQLINKLNQKTLYLDGDQRGPWWESLTSRELSKISLLISGYDIIFIDEAQRIPEIGLSLKIILDNFPQLKVIVTGSSSLDLSSKISEPLTGRIYSYHLFPISQAELRQHLTPHELESNLESRLIFGSYPELFSFQNNQEISHYLKNLTNTYLYKDMLEFGDIRHSSKIHDLLKLLAFQVGSQVSRSELASSLEVNRATVNRYIDLLEKSFIVFRLPGFNRNLRKEVTKMDKIYFYDLGVRNILINNLNLLSNRDDVGKLWENFLIIERIKRKDYAQHIYSHYFWRLTSGAEVDLIEESAGSLHGFEFKYSSKQAKPPKSWQAAYPQADFSTVNRESWQSFVI